MMLSATCQRQLSFLLKVTNVGADQMSSRSSRLIHAAGPVTGRVTKCHSLATSRSPSAAYSAATVVTVTHNSRIIITFMCQRVPRWFRARYRIGLYIHDGSPGWMWILPCIIRHTWHLLPTEQCTDVSLQQQWSFRGVTRGNAVPIVPILLNDHWSLQSRRSTCVQKTLCCIWHSNSDYASDSRTDQRKVARKL